jgi:hypothetical protein
MDPIAGTVIAGIAFFQLGKARLRKSIKATVKARKNTK